MIWQSPHRSLLLLQKVIGENAFLCIGLRFYIFGVHVQQTWIDATFLSCAEGSQGSGGPCGSDHTDGSFCSTCVGRSIVLFGVVAPHMDKHNCKVNFFVWPYQYFCNMEEGSFQRNLYHHLHTERTDFISFPFSFLDL